MTSHIQNFLENSAARFPDKIALIHGDVRATYAQINTAANSLSNWLIENKVSIGDRVVILLENSLEYVISYYAILKSGAIAVPLSTAHKPDTLNPLLSELEPATIITSKKFERLLNASDITLIKNSKLIIQNFSSVLNSKGLDITGFDDTISSSISENPIISTDEKTASIIYTSGSTGKPKGVMLSHKNIIANAHSICRYLELTENDIQMVVLPFFYVMGKSLLNTHFSVGGTVVINNRFAFPADVINEMIKEKVTGFSGVPSTYAYLLHRSPLARKRDQFNSLRYCSQAGGHMADSTKKALRQALPAHTKIYIMYGATEASARLSYLPPEHFGNKMGSIGKPIPGVRLRVMDKKGNELPAGERGEIIALGENITRGYWKDPEGTARVLDRNGYHTGDLGYMDKKGFFYVESRRDSLIKVSGHRLNPREIEDVLIATHMTIEAAVIGIPDPLLGNKLVAVVVPQNGDCTPEKLLETCASKLPKYKLPSEIKLTRLLPKSPNGKIDKQKCIAMFHHPD